MKTAISIQLLSVALLLIAFELAPGQDKDGGSKSAELIVGKWTPASGKEKGTFVAFTADGEMTYTFGKKDDMTYKAKYRLIGEKQIEVEWTEETLKKNNLLSKKAKTVPLSVTKDQLNFNPALMSVKKSWVREK